MGMVLLLIVPMAKAAMPGLQMSLMRLSSSFLVHGVSTILSTDISPPFVQGGQGDVNRRKIPLIPPLGKGEVFKLTK